MVRIRDLRRRIRQLLRGPANVDPKELVRLALSVGRMPAKRGKEPTFVLEGTTRLPLTIPAHRRIGKYTVIDILRFLLDDLDYLERQQTTGSD